MSDRMINFNEMNSFPSAVKNISFVSTFPDLVATDFRGRINALCWDRALKGDYQEIVQKLKLQDNLMIVQREDLMGLDLTEDGQMARSVILNDLKLLEEQGASPILNLIDHYESDDSVAGFPTDVYSFHIDRSPVPTDTYLCTYYGDVSELVSSDQVIQKIMVPELREQLKKLYQGPPEGFEDFLTENFFDLHYAPLPGAEIYQMQCGQLWKLAVDHPTSAVKPCVHRAPRERSGLRRLLLIC
jgi:hypothetical protein